MMDRKDQSPLNDEIPSHSGVCIFLFGSFEVQHNGENITNKLWQSRQVRGVLKILVARRGRVVPSEQIMDVLWPDVLFETAKNRLYVRISQLRHLFKNAFRLSPIQTVEGGYCFALNDSDAIWVDVDAFEQSAALGRGFLEQKQYPEAAQACQQACNLYRGDYLSENIYDDWTLGERERLREKYLIVLTELSEAYAQLGRYRHSINTCNLILNLEPLRESVITRLMLYHYYAGNKVKSLQLYAHFSQSLKSSMNLEPDSYTTWLAQRIEDGTLESQERVSSYPAPAYKSRLFEVPYSLGNPPLVGREREYAWLLQQWQEHPKGGLVISGEAGVGKTRLAEAFTLALEAMGIHVIRVTISSEKGLALNDLVKAFDLPQDAMFQKEKITNAGVVNEDSFSLTLNSLSTNKQSSDQLRTIIAELIRKKDQPCEIWVDNAQFLDPFTFDILAGLLGEVGILLTGRARKITENTFYGILISGALPNFANLELKCWQKEAITDLLKDLGGESLPSLAQALYEKAKGHPLFTIASLQHLFEEGRIHISPSGHWVQSGSLEDVLSPTIETAIADRMNGVSSEERQVLDVLAVAGGEGDYDLLERILKQTDPSLLAIVDNLLNLGLVVEPRDINSTELRLAHDLYREVLDKTLPKARKRVIQIQIAEAMLALGQDSDRFAHQLARYFHEGGDDSKALPFALAAGNYALRQYLPQRALRHYMNVLSWQGQSGDVNQSKVETIKAWVGIGESLRLMGNYQEANEYYRKALPFLEGELLQAILYQIFQSQLLQGDPLSTYDDLTQKYQSSIEQSEASWALALFYWTSSFVNFLKGHEKETRNDLAKGWRVARQMKSQGNDPPYWVYQRALTFMMRAHNEWGNYPTAIRLAHRVLAKLTDSEVDDNSRAVVYASLSHSYFCLGQYGLSEENSKKCYELAVRAHDPRLQGEGLIGLGKVHFVKGEIEQASNAAQEVLALIDMRKDILRTIQAQFLLTKIAILSQIEPVQVTIIENILMLARYQEAEIYTTPCLLLMADICFSLQDFAKAQAYAQEALDVSGRCGQKREQSEALCYLAQVASALGQPTYALRLITEAIRSTKTNQTPLETATALCIRAELQSDLQSRLVDAQTALDLFESVGAVNKAYQARLLVRRIIESAGFKE